MTTHRPRRAAPGAELFAISSVVLVVAALLGPALMAARESARQRSRESQIRHVGAAVHSFHDINGHFPTSPAEAARSTRPRQKPAPRPAELVSPL